ncbi:2,4-dihydroxyhept-2-ene-1,7-dioic acid aldolase [Pseudohoeflea suaedae]|uniref:2,4-dihydroxyhept-2-ene-1,7-dioic acid aldolase n=1 Tax=Pseudohoeflea suaedae TaxID=877384 RepID=A0A4R5PPM4_9HYPH|nr:aldolase/citrate lyase family protein [Pseudohoeflea suaedae]TDH39042.1 2,4-dihydroxyhept-2-ene-1,7-dioic acid aldolase [Pseudohoeflea suaedae]
MLLNPRLAQPEPLFVAWSSYPAAGMPARMAHAGFDAVVIDMQHGMHTETSALREPLEIMAAGKPPILRIPVGRFDLASRGLDAGFEAVIAPMINTLEDARAFVAAMKYPPLGERSWGPLQALNLHREHTAGTYFKSANAQTLAIAMIETMAAVEIYEEILAIEGIDGLFVGPSDLSISWSGGKEMNPFLPEMQDFIAGIARSCTEAGKLSAIYANSAESAIAAARMGYRMITATNDDVLIQTGADAILGAVRG